MDKYTTFIRTCNNWREFANAPKIIQDTGLTQSEAREACREFNANLTDDQQADGTKMEFTTDDNL